MTRNSSGRVYRAGTVAVVIPTRDRVDEIIALLDCLAGQTRRPEETLVIDDTAGEQLAVAVRAWQLGHPELIVKYFSPRTNSVTRAQNFGADHTDCEFVMVMDDDLRVPPQYVDTLLHTLQKLRPAYAGGCALVTPRADFTPAPVRRERLNRWFRFYGFHDGRFYANGMHTVSCVRDRVVDTEYVFGGANIYRHAVIDEFRWSDRFNGYCGFEDCEFSYRVSRRHKLFLNPLVCAWHRDVQDKKGSRAQRLAISRMDMRNYLYHFSKNIPKTPPAVALMLLAVCGLFVQAGRRRLLTECRGYWRGLWETLRDGASPA